MGADTVTPCGTLRNKPSPNNAVFKARNVFLPSSCKRARTTGSVSEFAKASVRVSNWIEAGSPSIAERSGRKIPFRKTKLLVRASAHALSRNAPLVRAVPFACSTGLNFALAIGATLVYFHSSSVTAGKPFCSKSANESARSERSQVGSLARCSVTWRNASENSFFCSATSAVMIYRRLTRGGRVRALALPILQPVVTLLFQLQRQLFAALFDDAAGREYMDKIRHDVIQQSLVVRHHDYRLFAVMQFVDALCHNSQRIDVQT